jgi:hypothetical protein
VLDWTGQCDATGTARIREAGSMGVQTAEYVSATSQPAPVGEPAEAAAVAGRL